MSVVNGLVGREPDPCSCGVSLDDPRGQAYNQEAFRYFLTLERKRCERSARTFLLALVDLQEPPGVIPRIDPRIAPRLFASLGLCLRETDFIGWYREKRVIGAILTELGEGPKADVFRLVSERITSVLCERLPADVARRLRVRVYQHPTSERIQSARPRHLVL